MIPIVGSGALPARGSRLRPPLPTERQTQLLRLLLSPMMDAAGFRRWAAEADIAQLDHGTARLFPLLYLHLSAAGIDHPWLPAMHGWYQRTLQRNRLVIQCGLALVQQLADQGVDCLLLKGCPLVVGYYGDVGARPMADFDILIDERTPRAKVEALLADTGRAKLQIRSLHADTYTDAGGLSYDLHWYLQPELSFPAACRTMWDRAVPIMVMGRSFRTLMAEDHVFHALIHGMRMNGVAPMRWVVDVATIISATPKFDWDRIVATSQETMAITPVRAGLEFLVRAGLAGEAAGAALARLARLPERFADRALYRGLMQAPRLTYVSLRPWLLYLRLARLAGVRANPLGFARFLARLWNLESPSQVPAATLRRFATKIRAGPSASDL